MFASTWDAPVAEPPAAAPPAVAEAEKFLAEEPAGSLPEPVNEAASSYAAQESAHGAEQFVEEAKAEVAGSFVNGSAYSSTELLTGNETQEIPVYREGATSYTSSPLTEESPSHEVTEPVHAPESSEQFVSSAEPAVEAATPAAAQPNMDELVARVVAKMNPDVLQRVTKEILRPVIEALIKEELKPKK